jgi:hypothetical protein
MALFSRGDYIWLADSWATIIRLAPKENRKAVRDACSHFADLLAENSPGFDRVRFINAIQQQVNGNNHN